MANFTYPRNWQISKTDLHRSIVQAHKKLAVLNNHQPVGGVGVTTIIIHLEKTPVSQLQATKTLSTQWGGTDLEFTHKLASQHIITVWKHSIYSVTKSKTASILNNFSDTSSALCQSQTLFPLLLTKNQIKYHTVHACKCTMKKTQHTPPRICYTSVLVSGNGKSTEKHTW